jgi:hypothetical protein
MTGHSSGLPSISPNRGFVAGFGLSLMSMEIFRFVDDGDEDGTDETETGLPRQSFGYVQEETRRSAGGTL